MHDFLFNSKDIERSSYIWNMAGSMLLAFQSVIMLMIITRSLGLEAAGVYTIAYANANLFLTVGKYGMRNFQVSDVKGSYSFGNYFSSRCITTIIMLLVSLFYVLLTAQRYGYSKEKCYVILWMCLFKAVDSMEDVFHALYQKCGRLDVASKILTLRMAITIIFFGFNVVVTKNLLKSLIHSTLVTIVLFLFSIFCTYGTFKIRNLKWDIGTVKKLLFRCFPLFIGGFLSFYIGNAPKYAIDIYLSDEVQACYGFIAMPVFVIGLLNGFVFNPILYKISVMWHEQRRKEFIRCILRQCLILAMITVSCMGGGYLLGIPVLSILYHTDLTGYRIELLILLLGGGFLGLSGLLNTVVTIMRYQRMVIFIYGVVAIIALFLSKPVVYRYQIFGASIMYTSLMAMLCILFVCLIVYGLMKKADEKEEVR